MEQTMLSKLNELKGNFWTRRNELIEEIEQMGFEIVAECAEEIVVMADGDEDTEYNIWLIEAGRTIAVEHIEESEIN